MAKLGTATRFIHKEEHNIDLYDKLVVSVTVYAKQAPLKNGKVKVLRKVTERTADGRIWNTGWSLVRSFANEERADFLLDRLVAEKGYRAGEFSWRRWKKVRA